MLHSDVVMKVLDQDGLPEDFTVKEVTKQIASFATLN